MSGRRSSYGAHSVGAEGRVACRRGGEESYRREESLMGSLLELKEELHAGAVVKSRIAAKRA